MKKFRKIKSSVYIPNDSTVTVKTTGDIITLKYADSKNKEFPIERIDENHYVIKRTGEVCEYNHCETRIDNTQSVKQSLERLRDYINTNVTDIKRCRWITLTYSENMTDTARLVNDFRAFNRRCRKKYGHYEYITAAEPQGRGAWHLHAVFIFDKKAPFMKNDDVRDLWGQGFVNIKSLRSIDNIGLYLTAYLGDMAVDEAIKAGRVADLKPENIKDVEIEGKTKAFVKGARMNLYPKGFNIYRTNRGIVEPVVEKMCNSEAENLVKNYTKIYEQSWHIVDNGFDTYTNKRIYNKNPKAKKFIKRVNDDD
jgi:hypothetical protein